MPSDESRSWWETFVATIRVASSLEKALLPIEDGDAIEFEEVDEIDRLSITISVNSEEQTDMAVIDEDKDEEEDEGCEWGWA